MNIREGIFATGGTADKLKESRVRGTMHTLIKQGFIPLETLGPLLEEKLSMALWTWEIQTGTVRWSRGIYSLFGFQPDDCVPSYAAMEQVVHADDRRPQSEVEQALRESVAIDREMRVIMPDRRVRWVRSQLMPIMGTVGTPLTAVGVCTDITHDRETQHFLRLSASRFHALTRTSPSVYWTLTLDGRHAVILNSSAPDRKQGVDLRTLMDENSRREFDETCATFLPIRNPFKLTVRLRAEDGSFRQHRSRAMPIINEKGDVQEWLGVSQDPIPARDMWMKRDAAHRVTGAQMRAARAIIRWSVAELAAAAGVSPAVIRRLEENDGASPAEEAHEAIQGALLRAGVELTHDCDGKPGVRPR